MTQRTLSWRIFVVAIGVFLPLPLEKLSGDPVGSNGWHLNSPFQARSNADLVCKIQVISIRQDGFVKGSSFPLAPDVPRMVATSKVLSVIKGKCAQVIDVEFHYPLDTNTELSHPLWQLYTNLSVGEICLVFLKESQPYYRLKRIDGKARIEAQTIDYNLGDTPDLRLLAEFLAGCNSDDEMVKLQAVEDLGYLGDAIIRDLRPLKENEELFHKMAFGLSRAKDALQKARSCEDLVIRNVSIISSFQVDDSPGIEGPLCLLRLNPGDFDPNDSSKKYGIRDFCISGLQLRLLQTMDATTRRSVVDLKDGSVIRREDKTDIARGVRGFDYAEFFKQALDCELVKKNEQMRHSIANIIWIRYEKRSVPQMIRLLDDSSVRQTAVSALRKCINSDFSNSWERADFYSRSPVDPRRLSNRTPEKKLEDRQKDYKDNEQEYIQYWKKWWQENRDRFETSGTITDGTD